MSSSKAGPARSDLIPKFVGYRDVQDTIGVSRRTIERMVRDGTFAKPKQLTPNRVGWQADVIAGWLSSRQQGLLEATVNSPSELKDGDVENALQLLAGRWFQNRTGKLPSSARISFGDVEETEILEGALARLAEVIDCIKAIRQEGPLRLP